MEKVIYENILNITNDVGAAKLCQDFFVVTQMWDDFIDRDNELTNEEINKGMELALVEIPTNPFYIKNFMVLQPLVQSMIYKWYQANRYEDDKKQLSKAYMLRAGIYDLFAQCVIITRGLGTDINIYDLYGEDFNEYEKEFKCQLIQDN